MGDGGFYITLPSNSSRHVYPSNTSSCYTTKFAKGIDLKGDWEVSLIEFQYPHTWKTFTRGENAFELLDLKNDKTWKYELDTGYYSSILKLVIELNSHIKTHGLSVGYDEFKNRVFLKGEPQFSLKFSAKLEQILGLKPGEWWSATWYGTYPTDILAGFNTLYIYTDIIDYQCVGDSHVPLLRTVHITGRKNEVVTVTYDKPHYVPLSKRQFDEICIEVKSDQNQLVSFVVGKVIAKLHFRPVKQSFRV